MRISPLVRPPGPGPKGVGFVNALPTSLLYTNPRVVGKKGASPDAILWMWSISNLESNSATLSWRNWTSMSKTSLWLEWAKVRMKRARKTVGRPPRSEGRKQFLHNAKGGELRLDGLQRIPFDLFDPELSNALVRVVYQCGIPTVAAKEYIERGEHHRGLCASAPATQPLLRVGIWTIAKVTSFM